MGSLNGIHLPESYSKSMSEIIRVIVIGTAISVVFLWISIFLRVFDPRDKFKWWIKVIVPQGIVVAWALYLLGYI